MQRRRAWATALTAAIAGLGCGGGEAPRATAAPTPAQGGEREEIATVEPDEGYAEADESLPAAPWLAAHLPAEEAPEAVLDAWSEADNREWCAPMAPSDIGEATARASEYSGGWAVEFDQRGAPGIRPNGRACARCGRGAFGVAGTAIRVTEQDPDEAEEERFRDGSFARIEPSGDEDGSATAASIRVVGQECVYQVWSLVSEDHLRALVASLRFVDLAE